MRTKTLTPPLRTLLLCTLLLASLACAQKRGADANAAPTPTPPQQAAATPTPSATCRLLSAADIREAQGEEPTDAQGSEHLANGLSMSQCFYPLPTFSKSVNLEVVRAAPGSPAGAVREFWRKRFSPEAIRERERERERREEAERRREQELERERKSGQVREGGHTEEEKEGEEEEGPPRRVPGVGDAAFWSGGEKNTSLYVLSRDAVVRVGVGGGEADANIKKAVGLARKVLKQL